MNVRLIILNCTCRTQGKLPSPSGSCPWPRLKGTWKMFLHTNRPFHSDVSVVVLGGQPRPRIDTLMDKEGGQSSQLSLSWICWRMQRVMLRSVSFICFLKLKLIFFFYANLNVNYFFPGQRFGCWCSICFTYSSQSSTEAKTQNIQSTWKNQPYVSNLKICFNWLLFVVWFYWCLFFCCSLHVISLPHWVDIIRKGRGSSERGILFALFLFGRLFIWCYLILVY